MTRGDKIRNKFIRGSIGVAPIIVKMRENSMKWLGHILKKDEDKAVNVPTCMWKEIGKDKKRKIGGLRF